IPDLAELDGQTSNSVGTGFTGADADRFFDIGNENLAVADAAGLGGAADGVDRLFQHVIAEHDLDFHLGQKIDDVFGATVKLGMALLTAEALGFGHGDALKADFLQRLLHLVELERLDDGFDLLHPESLFSSAAWSSRLTGRSRLTMPEARPRVVCRL